MHLGEERERVGETEREIDLTAVQSIAAPYKVGIIFHTTIYIFCNIYSYTSCPIRAMRCSAVKCFHNSAFPSKQLL